MMTRRPAALALIAALALPLGACEKGIRSMYSQPKNLPYSYNALFPGGQSARPRVPDTVAAAGDDFAGTSGGRKGDLAVPPEPPVVTPIIENKSAPPPRWPPSLDDIPVTVTAALMRRGRERYDIYCSPCHSRSGDGDGQLPRRGYPAPETFHSDRLRGAPNRFFYAVITRGYGIMFPYAADIVPRDRWAIVAYIRALQLSRYAPLAMVPPARRAHLDEDGGKAGP
jgi:mono/diheme cytochrome c family protein